MSTPAVNEPSQNQETKDFSQTQEDLKNQDKDVKTEDTDINNPSEEVNNLDEEVKNRNEDGNLLQVVQPLISTEKTIEGNDTKKRRQSFVKQLHAISVDEPPHTNPCGFIVRVFALCLAGTAAGAGLFFCIGILVLSQLFPIMMIIVGALHLDKQSCTADDIPLLLVIGGCIFLTQGLLATAMKSFESKSSKQRVGLKSTPNSQTPSAPQDRDDLEGGIEPKETSGTEDDRVNTSRDYNGLLFMKRLSHVISYATFAWYVYTAVVVYRLYPHVRYDEGAPEEDYCRQGPYRFAFWIITATLIGVGIIFLTLICGCCCAIAVMARSSDQDQP